MPLLLLLFLLFFQSVNGLYVPIAKEGRCVPQECTYVPLADDTLCLPLASGQWAPLKALKESKTNFTRYNDTTFSKLRKAYLLHDQEDLKRTLYNAYKDIASQKQLATSLKTLYYPSRLQLDVESFLNRLPFTWILLLLYGTSLFLPFLLPYALIVHTLFLIARAYILERPFVSNMAESLLYVSWVVVSIGLFFGSRKRPFSWRLVSLGACFLIGAFIWMGLHEGLEVVQAVLDSSFWLSTHVLIVCTSYALFLLASLFGHAALIAPKRAWLLSPMKITLFSGVVTLILGTLLGGIWASQSWGRFWDWDPKESWAFICICLYLIALHAYHYGKLTERGLAYFSVLGFLFVAFTWYGVNYILGTGLHSYGFGEGRWQWAFWGWSALEIAFCCLIKYIIKFPTKDSSSFL